MAKQKQMPGKRTAPSSTFAGFSPLTKDLASIGLLYLVALVLFRGIIFNNAAFSSGGDTAAALSYQHAGQMLEEKRRPDVLWMPYFFSGMPTFGNVAYVPHNVSYVQTAMVLAV